MHPKRVRELLEQVKNGAISVESAVGALKNLPYEDIGYANIDHHRSLRQGFPEVIFCQNKESDEIIGIIQQMREYEHPVLATRVLPDAMARLIETFPDGNAYHRARIFTLGEDEIGEGIGQVVVVCAGTSDLPVAEEASITARLTGSKVSQLTDVGVAGIHRILGRVEMLRSANAIVVVAGMEGALAGVVGGLVDSPVIAVPTSVGYGANFGGLSALLTMLNSCSAGVTVVNIDNGFGAGFAASLINRRIGESRSSPNQSEV